MGGVAYIDNDGSIEIKDNSTIILNSAINTCILYIINSVYTNDIENSTISMNDQSNSMINKSQFLTNNTSTAFLAQNYLSYMETI